MWILPTNLKQSFLSVQGCEDSKEELSEQAQNYSRSAMWRSKRLSSKIWCSKWNKVYWLKHLFGATLKPSMEEDFAAWWTVLPGVIRASRFRSLEGVEESLIPAIYGPTSEDSEKSLSLEQFDLFGAGSKTFQVTSNLATGKSNKIWNRLVTRLKKEYLVREKLVLRTRERDYSYLLWTTHTSGDSNRTTKYKQEGTPLSMQVGQWSTPQNRDYRSPDLNGSGNLERKRLMGWTEDLNSQVVNWPTPTTMENEHDQKKLKARAKRLKERNNGKNGTKYSGNGCGPNLASLVAWGTPTTRDYKDGTAKSVENVPTNGLLGRMVHSTVGQPHPDNHNMNGKNLVLNPEWVLQLMGTTLEKTFFAWREMPLSNRPQNLPSENS